MRDNDLATKTGLQKHFEDLDLFKLQQHPFFPYLKKDIASGTVFPAVGKNEMRFYHSGGRLCVYRQGRMSTNSRYLKQKKRNGKYRNVAIPLDRLSLDSYNDIKVQCMKRWSEERELRIVSDMFPQFSIGKVGLPADRARLLDIESRFPTKPGARTAQDMIDCVFLTSTNALVFVEVKLTENPAVRSVSTKAYVEEQLGRYNGQLSTANVRSEVISVYGKVVAILNKLLDSSYAPPCSLLKKVPLLIVGKKSEPKTNSKERWQKTLLDQPLDFAKPVIGIDGRYDNVTNSTAAAGLDKFFAALKENPSWVA